MILRRIRAAFRTFGAHLPARQNEVRAEQSSASNLFRKKIIPCDFDEV